LGHILILTSRRDDTDTIKLNSILNLLGRSDASAKTRSDGLVRLRGSTWIRMVSRQSSIACTSDRCRALLILFTLVYLLIYMKPQSNLSLTPLQAGIALPHRLVSPFLPLPLSEGFQPSGRFLSGGATKLHHLLPTSPRHLIMIYRPLSVYLPSPHYRKYSSTKTHLRARITLQPQITSRMGRSAKPRRLISIHRPIYCHRPGQHRFLRPHHHNPQVIPSRRRVLLHFPHFPLISSPSLILPTSLRLGP